MASKKRFIAERFLCTKQKNNLKYAVYFELQMSNFCRNKWTPLCYLCLSSDQNGFWIPKKGPKHILLAFKDFRRVASLSSCFHSLFICLLTLTDLSNTPVLCPKCHVPVLGWVWVFLLCAPDWCSRWANWIEEWPHHFWIWKPSLKQEYANHNTRHILRSCYGARRRITACCPLRRGTYPSHSSSPSFDIKI